MEGETTSQQYIPNVIGMLLTIVGARYYMPAEDLDGYTSDAPATG